MSKHFKKNKNKSVVKSEDEADKKDKKTGRIIIIIIMVVTLICLLIGYSMFLELS